MKKHVLFVAAMFAASLTFAQSGEITSNRGENWLSESGDYAICFSATPFLEYFGNMFNGTFSQSAPVAAYPNDYFAIEIKKLKDSNTAHRGKLRLGFGSMTDRMLVPDLANAGEFVEDKTKDSYTTVILGAGLEKRVGSTRLVGVYGAEANIMYSSSRTKYEYGNSLEDMGSQLTEEKDGTTFGIGVGVFAGAEWFFAPKMSLGAEYTFGVMFSSTGNGKTTTEVFGDDTQEVETAGGSQFSLDNGMYGMDSYGDLLSGFDLKLAVYFQ